MGKKKFYEGYVEFPQSSTLRWGLGHTHHKPLGIKTHMRVIPGPGLRELAAQNIWELKKEEVYIDLAAFGYWWFTGHLGTEE